MKEQIKIYQYINCKSKNISNYEIYQFKGNNSGIKDYRLWEYLKNR